MRHHHPYIIKCLLYQCPLQDDLGLQSLHALRRIFLVLIHRGDVCKPPSSTPKQSSDAMVSKASRGNTSDDAPSASSSSSPRKRRRSAESAGKASSCPQGKYSLAIEVTLHLLAELPRPPIIQYQPHRPRQCNNRNQERNGSIQDLGL